MTIHWHRRDLRGSDNRGLVRAADGPEPVVPLFVFDPTVLEHASPIRVACLLDALDGLREWYRARGSNLLIECGEPSEVLPRVASARGADRVTWCADYSGLAAERDRAVTAALEDGGVDCEPVHDAIHHAPGTITPNEGAHYSVFSYFWKKWRDRETRDPVASPSADDLASIADSSGRLPSASELGFDEPAATPRPVTQEAARDRLDSFCSEPIYRYESTREYPAAEGTSRLSVHLKWGTIGIRELHAATEAAAERAPDDDARESVESFQRQLAWREFYTHVLAFNPETVSENFTPFERDLEWRTDPDGFATWKAGETGYPIVDAGMRQLRSEGWMHNRVRMIVASFLTKDLLIDWREGYDWFRRRLADHETANDVGGWQWAASTGTDAQPYFRIFNPMKQGRKYDPDAEYVRSYVSELEGVAAEDVHGWHDRTETERNRIAPSYPAPIVDHAERRERALEAFERAKRKA
ncbi:cryptochrome/photolyase family protein [Natrarchaeobius oligotrophus]|uniref:Deoxyribodipyrimidine photo-lyase n=1 Tax=Natrarchaeobius chitinivorans TaxID=1679083 RepID=A0A3N6LY20_NATCH|nr:deoxyribodipyrimidine photo-lyase [Natrarchaeobius chitinivorans]RQG95703.1 deoxyribodipyrimidine photo-lyase [Natrarchaeobius chitinivorans]